MCQLCGEGTFAAHAIALSERPQEILCGLRWIGTYEAAALGETEQLLRKVQAFSDNRKAMWKSPIVALSRTVDDATFEYFAGISVEPAEAMPAGFELQHIPEMTVASSWHGHEDGDVLAHYGQILDWLRANGLRRDRTNCDHREEYPHDVNLDAPPALRLMLPVESVSDQMPKGGGFTASAV